MSDHPTIERIRRARHEISLQFNHDPKQLGEHYLALQRQTPPERFYRPSPPVPIVVEGPPTLDAGATLGG
ncbi:MAG TPA: hypothetical protein PKC18_21160 [Lacipirellulaceae bacterium]|nr:hypothetical protein [Lacipirellulaceae bacterium]HMP04835.1 hypothetical protein [Lacipirellulaceae bacterium]